MPAIGIWMMSAACVTAQTTHLLDLYQGSARSDLVRSLSAGGYELADGEAITFDEWYSPVFLDLTLLLFTEVSDIFGITWGISSGESGAKYRIDPALHLGMTWQTQLSDAAVLSASFQAVIGGRLRERSCTADYGPLGVSEVNCRLAASLMPPKETLDYLLDVQGWEESRLSVRLMFFF